MDIHILSEAFHSTKVIPAEAIDAIQTDNAFRVDIVNHFRENKDRELATALLDALIVTRRNPAAELSVEDLMLTCYIVGLHHSVEDCLKIWEAKSIDFDTYAGLDIQLVVFAGVKETLGFLVQQRTKEAAKAAAYISGCNKSGEFDDLEAYFSTEILPWFV